MILPRTPKYDTWQDFYSVLGDNIGGKLQEPQTSFHVHVMAEDLNKLIQCAR